MPETLAQFDTPVGDRYGRLYAAKACGRERDDRLWEGWIEFENKETGETLRSFRETTQPNVTDLRYWATGLTLVYLEGALDRILPKTVVRPPSQRHNRHSRALQNAMMRVELLYATRS